MCPRARANPSKAFKTSSCFFESGCDIAGVPSFIPAARVNERVTNDQAPGSRGAATIRPMPVVLDTFSRPLRNLRLSVTDRCNLRCQYCMPEEEYVWLEREHLLTFEEISRLVDVFLTLGVTRVRLTGGEPLLRRDLPLLVEKLAQKRGLADLALTTNGLLLEEQALPLRRAGLHRLTVSLDTLDARRFEELTRRPGHDRVLAGIEAARRSGFEKTKIDS